MRLSGKLTSWNDEKGFGFVTPDKGGKPVFVHIAAFPSRRRRPETGIGITYELARDERGRDRAERVRMVGGGVSLGPVSIAFIVSAGFFAFVAIVAALGYLPFVILCLYLVTSLLTFLVYYFDKSAAGKGSRRTPEYQLHLWSILGGWPGALIAQQWLRHKSGKISFRIVFWATIMINVGALAYLLSPRGAWIRALLDRLPAWKSIT